MSRPRKENPSAPPPPLRGWAKVFGFPKDPRSFGRYATFRSPDGRHRLVFEPGFEYAMMRYSFQFRLVDREKRLVEAFAGLTSPIQQAWWSPDSRFVAVAADDSGGALLLCEVRRRRWSAVRFDPWLQRATLSRTTLRFSVDPEQFHWLFGERFPVPADRSIRLGSLRWFDLPAATKWKLAPALRGAPATFPSREELRGSRGESKRKKGASRAVRKPAR